MDMKIDGFGKTLDPLLRAISFAIVVAAMSVAGSVFADDASSRHGALLGAKDTVMPEWFKESFLDLEEDVAEAKAQGRRVILYFHQDGCPYCNALIEGVFALDEVERIIRADFDVIEINIWGDREVLSLNGKTWTEKTFSAELDVQFTPTLIFLGERGEVVLRLNGYLPMEEFNIALDFIKEREYERTTFPEFSRSEKIKSDGASGAMIAAPFFLPPPYDLTRNENAKPLAIFFERPSCERCEDLHRGPLALDETRKLLAGFDVVQIDTWSDTLITTPEGESLQSSKWAKRLNIIYTPTVVLFDAKGDEVIRSEAFFKSFHVQSMLDYVLSDSWISEPRFQRYISSRADSIRAQGIDVNIWK